MPKKPHTGAEILAALRLCAHDRASYRRLGMDISARERSWLSAGHAAGLTLTEMAQHLGVSKQAASKKAL